MMFNFKYEDVKLVIEQARQVKRNIMLVKEEHLYLMPDCRKDDGIKSHICYAEGFGPDDGADTFCQLAEIFGNGSDNCFYFEPYDLVFNSVIKQGFELQLEVTPLENGLIAFNFIGYPKM